MMSWTATVVVAGVLSGPLALVGSADSGTNGGAVSLVVGATSAEALDGFDAVPIAPDTFAVSGVAMAAAGSLLSDVRVAWVEPDHLFHATAVPDDPRLGEQTELALVGAAQAWDVTKGSGGVVVAVLDTAVDLTHPDLDGKLVSPADFVVGANCVSSGQAAKDHGTVVAGMIGAATDNGQGGAGLGWNTRVMPIAVLCADGTGFQSWVVQGIRYAADNGAGIINLSLAGPQSGTALADAVAYARSRGVIVVAAAGNSTPIGTTTPQYPAALPDVIAVGATTSSDALAGYSNRGPWVDLVAPGDAAFGPIHGGSYLGGFQGTSFAAPLVAATAALIVASRPAITQTGVLSRLQRSAVGISAPPESVGWGRLSAGGAVSLPAAGYWLLQATAQVTPLGDAGGFGSPSPREAAVIVSSPTSRGYWVIGRNGSIHAFGDAVALGSTAGALLNGPVVAAASTLSGQGLWLVTGEGAIISFGDAPTIVPINPAYLPTPVVAAARVPGSNGLWLAGSDGSVYPMGGAPAFGSMLGTPLNQPVVAIAPTPSGRGYWLSASDGGVFAFGDAPFYGSTGNIRLNEPIVGLVPTTSGQGYLFVARDGGVFAYGDAPFVGSGVGRVTASVVGLAR